MWAAVASTTRSTRAPTHTRSSSYSEPLLALTSQSLHRSFLSNCESFSLYSLPQVHFAVNTMVVRERVLQAPGQVLRVQTTNDQSEKKSVLSLSLTEHASHPFHVMRQVKALTHALGTYHSPFPAHQKLSFLIASQHTGAKHLTLPRCHLWVICRGSLGSGSSPRERTAKLPTHLS